MKRGNPVGEKLATMVGSYSGRTLVLGKRGKVVGAKKGKGLISKKYSPAVRADHHQSLRGRREEKSPEKLMAYAQILGRKESKKAKGLVGWKKGGRSSESSPANQKPVRSRRRRGLKEAVNRDNRKAFLFNGYVLIAGAAGRKKERQSQRDKMRAGKAPWHAGKNGPRLFLV